MKKYTLNEIKSLITSVERVESSAEFEDEFGNIHNIDEDIKQAEKLGFTEIDKSIQQSCN